MFTIILFLYLLVGICIAVPVGLSLSFDDRYTLTMLTQATNISQLCNCDYNTAEKLYVAFAMILNYLFWPITLTLGIVLNIIAAKRNEK